MEMKKTRVYYRVLLETDAALSVGGADNSQTDVDVVLDSRGCPVIPATSLTGALRAHVDEKLQSTIFGSLDKGEGALRVYDATFCGGNQTVSIRDSVSLEQRVATPGLKFDREIVERGARFCALLEVTDEDVCIPGTVDEPYGVLEGLIAAVHAGDIRLGAKKTRGMGRMKVLACQRQRFDLSIPSERDAWLDFDPFDANAWTSSADDLTKLVTSAEPDDSCTIITLSLAQVGGVSIREYTTEPEAYDHSQLSVHGLKKKDANGEIVDVPVVSGTSWAGAIRERYESFSTAELGAKLFGTVEGEDAHKSHISFSESVLAGGSWKTYTRNAIDRFTGGTISGALFTERSYFNGTTELELRIDNLELFSAKGLEPLVAVLADLHNGFLSVGGLASVGHGLFRITDVRVLANGQDRSAEFKKAFLRKNGQISDMIEPDIQAAARLLTAHGAEGNGR